MTAARPDDGDGRNAQDEAVLRDVWERNDPAYWSAAHTWALIQQSLRPTKRLVEVLQELRGTR